MISRLSLSSNRLPAPRSVTSYLLIRTNIEKRLDFRTQAQQVLSSRALLQKLVRCLLTPRTFCEWTLWMRMGALSLTLSALAQGSSQWCSRITTTISPTAQRLSLFPRATSIHLHFCTLKMFQTGHIMTHQQASTNMFQQSMRKQRLIASLSRIEWTKQEGLRLWSKIWVISSRRGATCRQGRILTSRQAITLIRNWKSVETIWKPSMSSRITSTTWAPSRQAVPWWTPWTLQISLEVSQQWVSLRKSSSSSWIRPSPSHLGISTISLWGTQM